MAEQRFRYTVTFEPVPEGGFNVVVPALPEVCTFGRTLDEARAAAHEAIAGTLEAHEAAGE